MLKYQHMRVRARPLFVFPLSIGHDCAPEPVRLRRSPSKSSMTMQFRVLATAALLAMPAIGRAQTITTTIAPRPAAIPADVASIDAIIGALYDVISGPAGQARDWNRFLSLFVADARLIPTLHLSGAAPRTLMMTPDQYAQRAMPNFMKNGFFEREIARTSDQFGAIAQVFSTYESRRAATDPTPFQRGINSIQLFNDGTRWYVVTVYWDGERPDNPIPEKYLKR
jgi:hypothetical protein